MKRLVLGLLLCASACRRDPPPADPAPIPAPTPPSMPPSPPAPQAPAPQAPTADPGALNDAAAAPADATARAD